MFLKSYVSLCVVMLLVQESLLCPVIHIYTETGADSNSSPQVTTILQSDNIREIFENVTQNLLNKQKDSFEDYKPEYNIREIVENVTNVLLGKQEERLQDHKPDFNIQEILENITNVILDKQEKNIRDVLKLLNVLVHPRDCQDIRKQGDTQSGVYTIYPSKDQGVSVYCDMNNDAWTVIQKRINGSENFKQDWASYRDGFGNADHEYWLGNRYIHLLTSSEQYQLRIDMTDQQGWSKHVVYDEFYISNEESGFTLQISGYHGYNNINDDFSIHNGMKFSTIDRDQDKWSSSCSKQYNGGWWYNRCHKVNINGEYGSTKYAEGVIWGTWTGNFESLSHVEMKIRRFMRNI